MRKGEAMTGLAALVLFGCFAVSVLTVLLTGAGAYRRLTARDQESFERRTSTQYLAARVRQAYGVRTEELAGTAALCLTEEDGYVTWVYCHEGWLMELYTEPETELKPEAGTRLVEAEKLSLNLAEGLLEVEITGPAGEEDRLYLSLRSGEGAAE